MAVQQTKFDWVSARNAYINDSPRPSYAELGERFGIPIGTLTRVSSDEGWTALRSARLEALATQSDGLEIILKAAKTDAQFVSVAQDAALGILAGILKTLSALEKDGEMKPRASMDILNTASFALQNTANACHRLGVVGLPDALKKAANELHGGQDGKGGWTPGLLASLNVTIHTMAEGQRKAEPIMAETSVSDPEPAKLRTEING